MPWQSSFTDPSLRALPALIIHTLEILLILVSLTRMKFGRENLSYFSAEPRRPIKYIHQLLNHDSGPLLAVPSQGIVQREPSSSPLLSPVPVSSSEDESDDEDEYDDYDEDEDEDGSVAYEEILSESAVLRSSSFDRSRGEVDVLHAVRASTSLRSVANGLQSFLGETLAPVIRASSSRLHHYDADSESATSISSHPERVRDSRTRNDISRDPYIVLFYGDEEESSQDSYLVEEVTSEFLEIQDNQVVLRMGEIFGYNLKRLPVLIFLK